MSTMPVNMTIWLQHPEVSAWCFNSDNLTLLHKLLPRLKVTLCETEEQFVASLPDTEIASVWSFRQEWFELAPKLQWLALPAAGRDYFDIELPPRVLMTNGAFHGQLMAETVVGMMLGMVRGVLDSMHLQQRELWPVKKISSNMRALRSSHVVILGFGNIGLWVAQLLKPFGVRITGIKQKPSSKPHFFDQTDCITTVNELHRILPQADHLVLALPRSSSTDHIINTAELELLPDHAVIYNVGRGNAINEAALATALHHNQIGGACLDVFEEEPLPAASPLRSCPNILLMPHASAIAPNYLDLFVEEFAKRYEALRRRPR